MSNVIVEGADTTIYVELLDESVDVWRPVQAGQLSEWLYRIPGETAIPEHEVWAFQPGMVVRCELRQLSEGPVLVAVEEMGHAA